MPKTTSLSFPNIFNVAQNTVNVAEDNVSVVNRTRLLLLTDPTELYNEPTFGAGLKRYLWQYNTENTRAMMQDKIVEQLREFEPYVEADNTTFSDGLLYTGSTDTADVLQSYNKLEMTVGLQTVYDDEVQITLNTEAES